MFVVFLSIVSVHKQAMHINLLKDGMKVEITYLRRLVSITYSYLSTSVLCSCVGQHGMGTQLLLISGLFNWHLLSSLFGVAL